jgi:hypothetical protein
MDDGKHSGENAGSFRADESNPSIRAERPIGRPSGADKPVNIGGGSIINKPGKPKGAKKSTGKP